MSTNIQVNCSGALFSSLQYELINNKKLQEGFLLGDVEKFTSHSISDSEIDNENVNVVINVSGYVPCSKMGSFYSGSGRVDFQYLKQFMDTNLKNVVGWYHSRKFSDIVFLKEMRIHEQLREQMVHTDGHFLFALFSRIHPADSGTMDVCYKFQIMQNNNEFEGVPLKIVNMNDTSSSQYIRVSPSASLYSSNSLGTILESLQNLEPGVKEAEQLHNGLLNQLRNLLPKYASIQEQHHKAARLVAKMQEFCHSSEIRPDFQPYNLKECDFDLMNLDSSPKFKTKQLNGSSAKEVSPEKSESAAKGTGDDPFGFIEKEMEKHQENGTPKKKVSRARNDDDDDVRDEPETESNKLTKAKSKIIKKKSVDAETLRTRRPVGRGRTNASSSPVGKTPKENTNLKKQNATPAKRVAKLGSLDHSPPSNNARHRSPSIRVKSKLKENEAWTETKLCTSDSPEF